MPIRFVRPDTLDGPAVRRGTITIRKRLTAGERRAMYMRGCTFPIPSKSIRCGSIARKSRRTCWTGPGTTRDARPDRRADADGPGKHC